jgi:hypothetical protein
MQPSSERLLEKGAELRVWDVLYALVTPRSDKDPQSAIGEGFQADRWVWQLRMLPQEILQDTVQLLRRRGSLQAGLCPRRGGGFLEHRL